MALSRQKKAQLIEEVVNLFSNSKLIVTAAYAGTSVQDLQQLRQMAKKDGTVVKVIKNRLVKKAISDSGKFSNVPLDGLTGQLLYAFNASDELAPAQVLAEFAKEHPNLQFRVGFNESGQLLSAEQIKTLATLPGKEYLRAQLISTIQSTYGRVVEVLGANHRSLVQTFEARASKLS